MHATRARIELSFGTMQQKCESLGQPWREGPSELDSLVCLVAGAMNHEKEEGEGDV